MNPYKKPTVFHKTSIDTAKTTYTTIALAGQKRTLDEYKSEGKRPDQIPLGSIASKGDFRRPELNYNLYPVLKAGDIQDISSQRYSEYSQRKALALTPNPTSNPLLDLSHPSYGLPPQLVRNFASMGVRSIYPWQSECLLRSGALNGDNNLVYTAPTGGGKSLVADILMLKKVIECSGRKALLVLPYVALVQEKLRWLRRVVEGISKIEIASPNKQDGHILKFRTRGDENNVRVVGFFGGSKSRATWADMDIAVCTIEKANSLVNSAMEDGSITKLGIVVIDELHMLDEDLRGYVLELMATKLLSLERDVQIVGMSATLNNAELLAKWLDDARFYRSRYRPVPIEEHLVFDNAAYPAASSNRFYRTATQLLPTETSVPTASALPSSSQVKPEPSRLISSSPDKALSNPVINSVIALANETARAGYGALVFCSSRVGCEKDAILISQVVPRMDEVDCFFVGKRMELLSDLRSTSTGLDSTLEKTIPVGVAFHHAGLTTEERDLIEAAFDQGVIKVIVATCSLAAGINLPARRVILHGARMGADLVGPSMLRQMRGRAGRKGKDEVGETYLCCQKSDLEAVSELMEAELPNVQSCLLPQKRGIKRALLEVVATKLATSIDSVDEYVKKTLLYQTIDKTELTEMVKSTLRDLEETKLITKDDSELQATLLGQAIVASSLTPEDGIFIHKELRRALEAFVMDGEMHVLYSFTPVHAAQGNVNWKIFRNHMENFGDSDLRAFDFIGLKPAIVNKMAQGGTMKENTEDEIETARVYKRFYAALQLRDLCNEMPIHTVARNYELPRGTIQSLSQTCHGFANGMIKFCKRMNWGALAAVLDHFSDRLKAGAQADILALAQINFIKSRTARVFWENGYKTVAAIAAADPKELLPVILQAQPKKVRTTAENEAQYHQKLLAKATLISTHANSIWEREMRMALDEEDI